MIVRPRNTVASNINLDVRNGEIPTALSRDTDNANQKVTTFDKTEYQERAEMAQVISQISNNSIVLSLKPKLDEAAQQKAEAEVVLASDSTAEQKAAAQIQLTNADKAIEKYGKGGTIQMAVRAVTGVLQGIATGSAESAVVGGVSPYANLAIKQATEGNDTANIMAHAVLGAIEAYATGNNAAAGAVGAASGELAAKIITEQLYGTTADKLTEEQKETVSALSQIAAGLSGALVGDNTQSAVVSAEIGKRAVENNILSSIYNNPNWQATAEGQAAEAEAKQKAIEQIEKDHPELIATLKAGGTIAGILADFTPVVGDVKSFAEAEDGIDFALALVGVIPGAKVVTKSLKEAKQLYTTARKAEKAGDLKQAQKNIDQAKILLQDNDVVGFYQSHTWRESFENQYGKNNVKSTTVPPSNAKNVKLAGQRHPVTGVLFDNKGFPIFEKYSKYETRLDINAFRNSSYTQQMQLATKDLENSIKKGYIDKSQFTSEQLGAIYRGEAKIPDYTWHHHQDSGRMQLIPEDIHRQTGHLGGEAIQKGK